MDIVFKDPICKNIAIRLSGGPDSAIIYYAICNFYKGHPDVQIFPYTMASPLRPHSIKKSQDIINFTAAATGKVPTKHYSLYHLDHNNSNSLEVNNFEYVNGQELLEKTLLSEQAIDIIYSGLSMNCPANELEKFTNSLNVVKSMKYQDAMSSRDTDRDSEFLPSMSFIGSYYFCLPFVNVDKRTVKTVFDQHSVTQTLFPLTWSCESSDQSDFINPKHCGACYFCLEREFVFGRL